MRARTPQSTNLTGLAQVRKINSLRLSSNLNSLLLFKLTKYPSPSLPGMTSFTSPLSFPIWCLYCDICDCHILPARAWTLALMYAPTHALSRKVLSLTKPKDKIHKTKNYNIKKILPQLNNITLLIMFNIIPLFEPSSAVLCISVSFICTQLHSKGLTNLIGTIDWTPTLDQGGPGSNALENVLHIL